MIHGNLFDLTTINTIPANIINIKIVSPDRCIVHYKIDKTRPFGQLLISYAQRQQININQLQYKYKNSVIKFYNTPETLNINNNDKIYATLKID